MSASYGLLVSVLQIFESVYLPCPRYEDLANYAFESHEWTRYMAENKVLSGAPFANTV